MLAIGQVCEAWAEFTLMMPDIFWPRSTAALVTMEKKHNHHEGWHGQHMNS